MTRRLPPLNAIRAFEAVGRHGSMSRAAWELSVTPSAVSRQISLLEGYLGQRLFLREGRGLRLTDGGRRYLGRMTLALDGIDAATSDLSEGAGGGRLTVATFSSFANEWLVPRLAGFRRSHPEIDFQLDASHDPQEPDRGSVDLAIRRGFGGWPGLRADLLFHQECFPVFSPALLGGGEMPASPGDLLRHGLLYSRAQLALWRTWLEAAGLDGQTLDGGLRFEFSSFAIQAARNGAGIALGQRLLVAEDLAAGRLLAPFGPILRARQGHYLASLAGRAEEPAIAAFRDWLLAEVRRAAESADQCGPEGPSVAY